MEKKNVVDTFEQKLQQLEISMVCVCVCVNVCVCVFVGMCVSVPDHPPEHTNTHTHTHQFPPLLGEQISNRDTSLSTVMVRLLGFGGGTKHEKMKLTVRHQLLNLRHHLLTRDFSAILMTSSVP